MECTTCDGPHPQCPHDGTRSFNVHLVRCGAEEGDAWAALFLSRLAKGHVFDERTQLHGVCAEYVYFFPKSIYLYT